MGIKPVAFWPDFAKSRQIYINPFLKLHYWCYYCNYNNFYTILSFFPNLGRWPAIFSQEDTLHLWAHTAGWMAQTVHVA